MFLLITIQIDIIFTLIRVLEPQTSCDPRPISLLNLPGVFESFYTPNFPYTFDLIIY